MECRGGLKRREGGKEQESVTENRTTKLEIKPGRIMCLGSKHKYILGRSINVSCSAVTGKLGLPEREAGNKVGGEKRLK